MFPKRRRPTSPSTILNEEFLKPLGLAPKELAAKLGGLWTESKVKELLSGTIGFSGQTAQELAAVFGTTPEFWAHLEQAYRDWESVHKHNEKGSLKPWKKAV